MSEVKDEKHYPIDVLYQVNVPKNLIRQSLNHFVLYKQPGREDIISVVHGMYKKDGLSVLARGSRL